MRTMPSPPIISFYESLGAEPQPLPLPGVRDALARGVIDGADMDLEIMASQGYSAAAPHMVLTAHMIFPVAAVVSARSWDALDDASRAVLTTAMGVEMAALAGHYVERESVWRSRLADRGVTFHPAAARKMIKAADVWWRHHDHLRTSADALQREITHGP
jgi:TRAP-type C4-dicarboxylate transport system substrate-binding protein